MLRFCFVSYGLFILFSFIVVQYIRYSYHKPIICKNIFWTKDGTLTGVLYRGKEEIHSGIELIIYQLKWCDNTPSRSPYLSISLNEFCLGRWFIQWSAGAFHISLWPKEIKPREWKKKNKRTIWACVNSKCKTSTSHNECQLISDRLPNCWPMSTQDCKLILSVFLTVPGLYLTWLVSSAVRCRLPLSVILLQLPSLGSFSNCLLCRSLAHCPGFSRICLFSPTSGLVGDLDSKPFIWFRTKTDKRIVC